ncbi:hypothetical protein [Streptomyces albus]|uniref:hypothetical protein n=1 Tax=Streptomyces albus TaxID=1888 RepID=UPI000AD32166
MDVRLRRRRPSEPATDFDGRTHHCEPDAAGCVTRVDARHRQESNAYDESGSQTSANWPADHAKPEARGPRHCTGLHYNCFRHHDPRTARYLSPAPWAWPRHSTR